MGVYLGALCLEEAASDGGGVSVHMAERFATLQYKRFHIHAKCYCKVLTVPNEPFYLTGSTSGLVSLNSIDGEGGQN